jgi:hypothetical protein
MTTPVIYFAGGEDSEFTQFSGGTVATTAGTFRSAFARCSLTTSGSAIWQNTSAFSASSFWWSAQAAGSSLSGGLGFASTVAFADSSNIVRLRLIVSSGTGPVYRFDKINAAGTITQLGSSFTLPVSITGSLDKFDIHIVDAVSGSVDVYLNGTNFFSFTGDTTTDGVSTIAYVKLGGYSGQSTNRWSECIVSDTDTRSWSCQTLQPVANGNTHSFDTGSPAAANVNEITLSDVTLDGSTTANQIDEYTIPALATGTFSIIGVGVSMRAQKGSSGPSKMDAVVRSGTTDYLSSDFSLTTAWANYQNWWMTDPNTAGLVWAALPVNIGLKSIT